MNGNGYSGYSMSNNAVTAYRNNEMPKSKWTKEKIMEVIFAAANSGEISPHYNLSILKKIKVNIMRAEFLMYSGYHHTSVYFNNTDFYEVDLEKIERLTEKEIDDLIMRSKSVIKYGKEELPTEMWECSFLEWSGSRRYPKATQVVEIGEIKGNWFYRADGSKKSINANGFRKIRKIS